MRVATFANVGAVFIMVAARIVTASPVAPGETIVVDASGFPPPSGTLVSESSRTVQVTYEPPAGFIFFNPGDGEFEGTLHSRVLRDPLTSRLTFVYEFAALRAPGGASLGNEVSELTTRSFGGFATDVGGTNGTNSQFQVARSNEGAAVTLSSDDPGLGGAIDARIATDALSFDTGGTLDVRLADEFIVREPDADPDGGGTLGVGRAVLSFTGTFQPVADSVPPAPIPLPLVLPGAATLAPAALRTLRPSKK